MSGQAAIGMQLLDGITFQPPEGFKKEEAMVSLRASSAEYTADVPGEIPRPGARPDLVIHRRKLSQPKAIADVAAEMLGELRESSQSMKLSAVDELLFDDAAIGVLVTYEFPANGAGPLRQYRAIRLDGLWTTVLTLTTVACAPRELQESYVQSLKSVRVPEGFG